MAAESLFRCSETELVLNKRRDATRVIHDILLLGRMGASKTQVISKANLSFPLADRYISFLLSKGHLRLGLDPRGVRRYTLTSKGERLLGFLAEIQRELEELFPNTSAAILTVAALSHGSLFDLDLRQGEG
ncbi:hypothetical protein E6H19_09425 [Candidatus Bathyarchaeota archaeon]|nr:MAG: hypothetical protein E6H19_09425 [Candidatus Bathyarchaeota archaeon]